MGIVYEAYKERGLYTRLVKNGKLFRGLGTVYKAYTELGIVYEGLAIVWKAHKDVN